MVATTTVVVLLSVVLAVNAHDFYRSRIPNGFNVPNPCGGGAWSPVGHYDPNHHTQLKNPFGMGFASAGHTWTQAFCNADSDRDGISNGAELGDPNCVWVEGAVPSGAATSHPGICEPIDSASCSHQTYSCGCHGHQCGGK